jgi:glycerophosphoryl diester phosphodiesterase
LHSADTVFGVRSEIVKKLSIQDLTPSAAVWIQTAVVKRLAFLWVVGATTLPTPGIERMAAAEPPRPLVIAHRGASGHRPEHTLEAYRLAVEMGADFIEPDLVSTKDGVLIARHENEISGTTDVAERFPDRRRTKTVDGRTETGWFTEDFTLAEIKTLRARERLPFRSHAYDGQFEIPTFDEVIALAQQLGKTAGRTIGVYPETKHPTYFRSIRLPLEEPLLASLDKHGWNRRDAPVFIQSFEQGNLRELRKRTQVRLVQLVSGAELLNGDGMKQIAGYADGLGPEKRLIVPENADGSLGTPTDVISRAHAAGLVVHVWTLRIEKEFLPAGYKGRPEAEFEQFRQLGVDGVFTDFPDVAVKAYGPYRGLHVNVLPDHFTVASP